MPNYQKLCDDVIEAHEELSELTEAIALVDKSDKAALQLIKEYYKLIGNLWHNLQRRLAAGTNHARQHARRLAFDAIDADEEESNNDGHIELENGQSLTFESQLLQMEYKRMIDEINNTHKD